jgi:hypothetical protein
MDVKFKDRAMYSIFLLTVLTVRTIGIIDISTFGRDL